MMRLRTIVVSIALAVSVLPVCAQQLGRDPLNDKEIDEIRETAQMPNKRLKAFTRFLLARWLALEQLQVDPKAENRGRRIHDLLQDIAILADELDENMDRYSSQSWDIRKGLKAVIEGQSQVYIKLQAMRDTPVTDPKLQQEAAEYRFALRDAIESLRASLDSARQTVQEQNQAAKDKALKTPDE